MKQIFMGFSILLSTLIFTACGGDSSTNSSTSGDDTIKVYTKQSLLDQSQTKFYLEFDMKNNYGNGVVAKLYNISLDLNACSISSSSLNVTDNTIEFSKPLESHTLQFTANLAKACTPTGYTVNGYTYLSYDGTSKKGSYSNYHPISIDGNLTVEDTKSIFEYDIKLESVDDESKIGLDSKKRYKLSLFNSSSNKNVIASRVHKMSIRSSDPSKVKLINPSNYSNDQGTPQSEITFNLQNETIFYIQTYNTSGVADFDVTINYRDNSGEINNIERKISVVILSGEPASFSIINDKNVTYDSDTKWFGQKFFISALDKHNNIVNTHSKIDVSTIADFRDNNGNGNRVLYGKFSLTNGKLITDKENHSASFKANKEVFKNINPDMDFLLLFGDATTSEASGKWNIDQYTPLKEQLKLSNPYYGDSHTNLGFAIGHNYINEICSSESKEWKLQIDSSDKTYKLDDEGKISVTIKFPEYMIGKKIALSVDFSEKEMRAGEVHFQTLYNSIDVNLPEDIEIDKNTTAVTPFHIKHLFSMTDMTGENIWVKNVKVICDIKTENLEGYDSILVSTNNEITNTDTSQCAKNGEKAFLDIDIRLKDEGKAGSMSFEKCQIYSFIDKF